MSPGPTNAVDSSGDDIDLVFESRASDLIKALNNPIRRSILRHLLDVGAATAAQARAAVTEYASPTLVDFHLDVLVKAGVITRKIPQRRRGSVYSCTDAARAEWVLTALALTALDD